MKHLEYKYIKFFFFLSEKLTEKTTCRGDTVITETRVGLVVVPPDRFLSFENDLGQTWTKNRK